MLENDAGVRGHLGKKSLRFEKRSGEVDHFSFGVVKVTGALKDKRLNPERAHVGVILRTAVEVFGIGAARPAV